MKKKLILLPILMLSLAACNDPAGSTSTSPTPSASTSAKPSETPSTTPEPSKNYGIVDTPVAGTAYKLGLKQTAAKDAGVYFLTSEVASTYYFAGVKDGSKALDVVLEDVAGGYVLTTNVGGAKKYIEAVKSGKHVNIKFQDAATADFHWTYKAEWKTVVATFEDAEYFMGTRGTYTSFGCYGGDTVATNFVSHFYADGATGEYPVFDVPPAPVVSDPTHAGTLEDPYTVADAILVAQKTGETATADKFYIKGVATNVNTSGIAQHKNITVDIKDEGADNKFTCYQIKDIDGADFTADRANAVEVGDTIVVVGNIVNYKGNTPETTGKGAANLVSVAKAPAAPVESITGADVEVEVGKSKAIVLTFAPENTKEKEVTYVSNNPEVATVDETGRVTGVAVGTTTVTVTSTVNAAVTATVNITVKEATVVDPGNYQVIATHDFTTGTAKGTYLTTATALEAFNRNVTEGTSAVEAITAINKVTDGNQSGGLGNALPGLLKFGTGSANGTITIKFADGTNVAKVVINCHSFHKVSDSYPTNDSNFVKVNDSEPVAAPYNATGAGEDLEFVLGAATDEITIASHNPDTSKGGRFVMYSVTFYAAK